MSEIKQSSKNKNKLGHFARAVAASSITADWLSLISSVATADREKAMLKLFRDVAKAEGIPFSVPRDRDQSLPPKTNSYLLWTVKQWPIDHHHHLVDLGKAKPGSKVLGAPATATMPSDFEGGREEWKGLTPRTKDRKSNRPAFTAFRTEKYKEFKETIDLSLIHI